MVQLVLYGSTIADSTLTTANDMATAAGGAETSVSNDWGGTGQYGELYSDGGTGLPSSTSIPATPSGHGWIYYVGAGSFALGNWTATFAHSCLDATIPIDFTLRFFKYSSGVYTAIGSIAISPGTGALTRTVYTFPATAMASVAFDTPDYLYVDLWEHDATGIAFQDTGTLYLSTTSTAGVTNDLQITTADFAAGAGSGIIDPTIFGTAVADATLTTACDVALTTGGAETSKITSITGGSGNFAEVCSQGNAAAAAVTAIAANPTGRGWVYRPGAGTFLAGNWSASITATTSNNSGTWNFRVFSHIGTTYALVGTLTASITGTTKTTYTFSAVSFPAVTLSATDYLYFDLWYQDTTGASSESVTIFEATTTSGGVASDMQINTASFAPLILPTTKPFYVPRGFLSTIVPDPVTQPLAYVDRPVGGTIIYENRTFIPRALSGIYIPDTVTYVDRPLGGTLSVAAATAILYSFTETLFLADNLLVTETGLPINVLPVLDSVFAIDSATATEANVVSDSASGGGTGLPVDSLSTADSFFATDINIAVETLPVSDSTLITDAALIIETNNASDSAFGSNIGLPIDSLATVDNLLATDTDLPVDSLTTVDSLLATDTDLPVDSNSISDLGKIQSWSIDALILTDILAGIGITLPIENQTISSMPLDWDIYSPTDDGLVISDSFTSSETTPGSVVTTTYSFTEALLLVDSVLATEIDLALEANAASDGLSGGGSGNLVESLLTADVLLTTDGLFTIDSNSAGDTLLSFMAPVFVDTLTPLDSLFMGEVYLPLEAGTLLDRLLLSSSYTTIDTLILSDMGGLSRSFIESLLATDTLLAAGSTLAIEVPGLSDVLLAGNTVTFIEIDPLTDIFAVVLTAPVSPLAVVPNAIALVRGGSVQVFVRKGNVNAFVRSGAVQALVRE